VPDYQKDTTFIFVISHFITFSYLLSDKEPFLEKDKRGSVCQQKGTTASFV